MKKYYRELRSKEIAYVQQKEGWKANWIFSHLVYELHFVTSYCMNYRAEMTKKKT